MNKQQIASKIWESANQMRSKIEANEYKDYILGFIFYKYLSDRLEQFAIDAGMAKEDIQSLNESDTDTVEFFRRSLGYFISGGNLFSNWLELGGDFEVANVRDALSAFGRLIHPNHKELFDGIFKTLETGLSKLGDTAAKQSKAISELIQLIKDIPMDGRQGYDVLGFIYEYLISMFAANAGKKAGEFYTPHEVSVVMSEIIADHVKAKERIDIYDSTSGSGSLLLNIGKSITKQVGSEGNIKYYAQELKENTYNLTRMNLIMRGIIPSNIVTRNGDTLEDDWPFFNENDPVGSYSPLYLDAVVSNPPYSQKWDTQHKESDPRYSRFGIAPKSKADFAFLLHDLYHLKPDGIMAIVLPHGVLFRGGEEEEIRKNLIENDHIDVIIGLPPNIFFGTGIPTIILVLKQKRELNDVLIVDASKGFSKEGKNNKLRACDIKKITDTVVRRQEIEGYSRVISKTEIRENGYNLNIPRYVDSSEPAESWDLYASMFGGIPQTELDALDHYWQAFPSLRSELFSEDESPYVILKCDNLARVIRDHAQVQRFIAEFVEVFADFASKLKSDLIENLGSIQVHRQETLIAAEIFERLSSVELIDKYQAYQLLAEKWQQIAIDLEIIQTEGFEASCVVEPNFVIKKRDGKDVEVQDGWKGRILPFEVVQSVFHRQELDELRANENRLREISASLEEIIQSLSEEKDEYTVLNDANDRFVASQVNSQLRDSLGDVETPAIKTLKAYLGLFDARASRPEKLTFIAEHPEIVWGQMEAGADGTYAKAKVSSYIVELQSSVTFPEDSFEYKLIQASNLLNEEKELKSAIKKDANALHLLTKETIEGLRNEQVKDLLELKWIMPLQEALHLLPGEQLDALTNKIQSLVRKYKSTYADNARNINKAESELVSMLDELHGNEFDLKAISEMKTLLEGK